MNYDQAAEYLRDREKLGIRLGNERFLALLALLGDPHLAYPAVHVAGTKGKGSTTAMVASILSGHGLRVGGYYSPYVYDLRERVQLDGANISREDFARTVSEIAPHAESIGSTDHGPITEFEFKTAVGLLYFSQCSVDVAAVEVGLGGRLDATNVVRPIATVITNIGLDHTEILGPTTAHIAAEKAGIIKPGIPVVSAATDAAAIGVITETASRNGSPLLLIRSSCDRDADRAYATWSGADGRVSIFTPLRRLSDVTLGMRGDFQWANAACAVSAAEVAAAQMGRILSDDLIMAGLADASLPARMQVLGTSPLVLADGAHNGLAAAALACEVRRIGAKRLILVVGMVSGHDISQVVSELAPLASRVYATQPNWHRAADAAEIAAEARRWCGDVRVVRRVMEAVEDALIEANPDDLVLITGSFYTVGEATPEAVRALHQKLISENQ